MTWDPRAPEPSGCPRPPVAQQVPLGVPGVPPHSHGQTTEVTSASGLSLRPCAWASPLHAPEFLCLGGMALVPAN